MADLRKGRPLVKARKAPNTAVAIKEYALDDAFDYFYQVKKTEGMRDRTLKDYVSHWRYFRGWLDANYRDLKLREVSSSVIRGYVAYMSHGRTKYEGDPSRKPSIDPLSPTTVSIRLRTLRTMFRFWAEEGIIPTNPTAKIKPPIKDEEGIQTFTDDHLVLLLAQADRSTFAGNRNWTLMYLLSDSGLRINEVGKLTEDLLDLRTKAIHLPASMNKNRRPRVIPVSPEVMHAMLELIAENKSYFGSDATHIFLSSYGEPLKADQFRKQLHEYGVNAGIADKVRVSPHTFRHYFCKTYLLNGGDIFSLQRIVGHSSIETTRKYVQLDDESTRQQHALHSPLRRIGVSRINKRRR